RRERGIDTTSYLGHFLAYTINVEAIACVSVGIARIAGLPPHATTGDPYWRITIFFQGSGDSDSLSSACRSIDPGDCRTPIHSVLQCSLDFRAIDNKAVPMASRRYW